MPAALSARDDVDDEPTSTLTKTATATKTTTSSRSMTTTGLASSARARTNEPATPGAKVQAGKRHTATVGEDESSGRAVTCTEDAERALTCIQPERLVRAARPEAGL